MDQSSNVNIGFDACFDNFGGCLFQLIVLLILSPDFNCCSFALSWVNKVTDGMYSFVSAILNSPVPAESAITHFADEVNMRFHN